MPNLDISVAILSECNHDEVQNAIYDALDALGIDYKVNKVSLEVEHNPAENHLGGFRSGDPSTSQKGAVDAYPRSGTHRWAALMEIATSPYGMTYAEVEYETGIRGIWKRISELKDGGWVVADGERFIPATQSNGDVYYATEKARRYIQAKEPGTIVAVH